MKEVGPASVTCRYSHAGCVYNASGSEGFVHSNYRQHLRESHLIAHPRVEDGEVLIASVEESVNAALERGYAQARASAPPAAPAPAPRGEDYFIRRSDTGNVARARLFCGDLEMFPDRAQSLMRGPHAAFDYGYAGEGPRTLALALLIDALRNAEAAWSAHGVFAAEFLNTANATQTELAFTRRQILQWFKGFAIGSSR